MMNIEEEKEIVEKMKKKGNSEVEYAEGMVSRWEKVLDTYGIPSLPMYREDATFYRTVYRNGDPEAGRK